VGDAITAVRTLEAGLVAHCGASVTANPVAHTSQALATVMADSVGPTAGNSMAMRVPHRAQQITASPLRPRLCSITWKQRVSTGERRSAMAGHLLVLLEGREDLQPPAVDQQLMAMAAQVLGELLMATGMVVIPRHQGQRIGRGGWWVPALEWS